MSNVHKKSCLNCHFFSKKYVIDTNQIEKDRIKEA